MSLTALVLADTHLRFEGRGHRPSPMVRRWLPPSVLAELARADVVLHAGDVVDAGALDRLRREAAPAPVHAVLGNNDTGLEELLPQTLVVDLAGVRVGLMHDSGPRKGRERRLGSRFPDCEVVVFGHSHEPVVAEGLDGQLLFNPGSPTYRRRQPVATYGLLHLDSGRVVAHEIRPV